MPSDSAAIQNGDTVRRKRSSALVESPDNVSPPSRKIKQEVDSGSQTQPPNIKRELPGPDFKTKKGIDRKDRTPINTLPAKSQSAPKSITQEAAPIIFQDDDDDLQILDFRPAPPSQPAAAPAATVPVTKGGELSDILESSSTSKKPFNRKLSTTIQRKCFHFDSGVVLNSCKVLSTKPESVASKHLVYYTISDFLMVACRICH